MDRETLVKPSTISLACPFQIFHYSYICFQVLWITLFSYLLPRYPFEISLLLNVYKDAYDPSMHNATTPACGW